MRKSLFNLEMGVRRYLGGRGFGWVGSKNLGCGVSGSFQKPVRSRGKG